MNNAARKRKWSRFRVTEKPLSAKIVGGNDRTRELTSLSLGGCAFLSRRADSKLLRTPEVKVEFQIDGKKVVVEGQIQYFQFMPQSGMDTNLLGIEFNWKDFESRREFGLLLGEAVGQGNLEQS